MYTCLTYVRAILTVTHVHTAARNPAFGPSPSSLCLTTREKGGGGRDGRAGTKGDDGVRFCARVQRLRAGREGGTSITRYIGRKRRTRRGGGGRNRPGRGAGKSSRAANCPPSYPPYTLSHTLDRNHPYPPLPPPRFPPTRPSHPTRYSTPPPSRRGPPRPVAHLLPSPSFSYLFTSRHPSPSALSLDGPRRLESFRLPTPYKRSCCPFITTTPTTTTTEGPTRPHFLCYSALPFVLRSPPCSTVQPPPPPAPVARLPSERSSTRTTRDISFVFSRERRAAILINALTLPLHNCACPLPDSERLE